MKILLWHGFLLAGSGSNVYTANIARSWRAAGHDVLVMCQDRVAHGFDFVDRTGDFDEDNLSYSSVATGASRGSGTCSVVRPNIGGLLPVYVYDDYEGFTVKLFVDLTDEELESYTSRNVTAMVTAIERFHPDSIVTGHEVMGPSIARRACAQTGKRYVAKLHGSALEFAVRPQERYRHHAREGLGGASHVVGGSRYMVEAAAALVGGWEDRASVLNPGCDVDLFRPAAPSDVVRDSVGFVGKLIAPKGVHNLLAAIGLTKTEEMSLVVVGQGGFEAELREIESALRDGDTDRAREIAVAGESGPLHPLVEFLSTADVAYYERRRGIPVEFAGHLEHDELSKILPTFDVLVVPSVVPEAFGMVVAEAAAAGVLPIVPDHSGIAEAGAAIEYAVERPGLLTYDSSDPIRGIAAAIDRVLALTFQDRRALGQEAARLARERWSWERVAARLLELGTAG